MGPRAAIRRRPEGRVRVRLSHRRNDALPAEGLAHPRRLGLAGVHQLVWHGGHVGALHVQRGPRLFPAFGDAHEGRESASVRQGSFKLQVSMSKLLNKL